MNSKFFQLPDGTVAVSIVPVDPQTGAPLASTDPAACVHVLGRTSSLDNVLRDTWDGPTDRYVFPASPIRMQVTGGAQDTANGTGIRIMEIDYLDANYVQQIESITLNGATPVLTTATDILRVNKLHAHSVGSGGGASATINLTSVGGGVTYSQIPAGLNVSRQAIYTVPEGYFLRIEQWQVSSGSSGAHFCIHTLVASSDMGVLHPGIFLAKDEQGTQDGGEVINYPFAFEDLPPRCDIRVTAISDNPNANVIALTGVFGRLYPMPA